MASGIRAGRAYVELLLDDDKFKAGLSKAQARLNQFASAMKSAALPLAAFGAAITAPLTLAVRTFISMGSAMSDMADRTGMSVEALSELSFAAQQTGASIDDVETSVKKMQQLITDAAGGSKEASDSFAMLGVAVEDIQGLSPERQFQAVAQALNGIADPTERAAVALEIFGRSGTKILPLVKDMDGLTRTARELSLVMSTEEAAAADKLGDLWDVLVTSAKVLATAVGSALAPALQMAAEAAMVVASVVVDLVRAMPWAVQLFGMLGLAATAVGGAMLGIAAAAKAAALTVSGLRAIRTAIDTIKDGASAARGAIRGMSEELAKATAKRAAAGAVAGAAGGAAGGAAAGAAGTGAIAAVAGIGVKAAAIIAAKILLIVGLGYAVYRVFRSITEAITDAVGWTDYLAKKYAAIGWGKDDATVEAEEAAKAQEKHIAKRMRMMEQLKGKTREVSEEEAKVREKAQASAASIELTQAQINLAEEERRFAEQIKAVPTDALTIATARFSESQRALVDALTEAQNAASAARVEGTEAAAKKADAAKDALDAAYSEFSRWQSAMDSATSAVEHQAEERKRMGEEALAQERELLDRAAAVRMSNEEDMARREQDAQRQALAELVEADPSTALEEFQDGLSDAEEEVARIEEALAAHEAAFKANPAKSTANLEMMESLNEQLMAARDEVEYFADGVGQARQAMLDAMRSNVEAVAGTLSTINVGTFSSEGSRALSVADPAILRSAIAAEQTARNTQAMLVELRNMEGSVFE